MRKPLHDIITKTMQIFKFIKSLFNSTDQNTEMENSDESEFCIIGNIVDKHFYGELKEIRRGTKHFRPNAKVYCLPEYGGMAHEKMVVVGMHRKSKRLIKIAIPTKRIKDFRIKSVYKPRIIDYIRENYFYEDWRRKESTKNDNQKFVDYLNSQTEEVE